MSKELDVVVFGASGYTGKLVVEYLKEEYGDDGDLCGGIYCPENMVW